MTAIASTVSERVDALAWDDLTAQLDDRGFAVTEPLLTAGECAELAQLFDGGRFRSRPLILRYGAGDWNALHQDLYGDVYFPFQILTVLTEEHAGGEFVLLEQRPRAQSRPHVLNPPRGAFVIFPTRERPELGKRGHYKVGMRHGVSTVTAGSRTALGVIFHDAR